MAILEEFGAPCVCGAENFQRVIVERVFGRPVVTDLVPCVECNCVYYSPLPKPLPPEAPRGRSPMPSGVVSDAPGLLKGWGSLPDTYRPSEQSPEELRAIREAAARASKGKKRTR